MNKKHIIRICLVVGMLLVLFLLLYSVLFKGGTSGSTLEAVVIETTETVLTIYRISDEGDSLLVVGLEKPKLVGEDGSLIEAKNIQPRQRVKITYDGVFLQIYPAIINNCYEIRVLGQADVDLFDKAVAEYAQFNASNK